MTDRCPTCNRPRVGPCAHNDNARPDTITIPRAADVMKPSYMRRLAMAVRSLDLSRREVPNWMADQLFNYPGKFISGETGREVVLGPDVIDSAFGDDGSFRWLSDFLAFAERDPANNAQHRVIRRLQLLALAFWISAPGIARHFA